MKLSPEAEAEIDRLLYEIEDAGPVVAGQEETAMRAAMRWAYADAAKLCERIAACECMLAWDCPHWGASECAKAIEARATTGEPPGTL